MSVVSVVSVLSVPLPFLSLYVLATLQYPTRVVTDRNLMRAFQFLFFRFRPEAYFYGTAYLGRNLLVCIVPAVFRSTTALQVFVTGALLQSFGAWQNQIQPWRARLINMVDSTSTSALVLTLFLGALYTNTPINEQLMMHMSTGMCLLLAVSPVCAL